MSRTAYVLFFFLLPVAVLPAQESIDWLRADAAYDDQLNLRAMHYYKKLMRTNPHSPEFYYNIGNIYYRQGEFHHAAMYYQRALNLERDFEARSHILYNLGNSHFRLGDFRRSLGFYREALRIEPHDADSRHNLELALRRLQQRKSGLAKSVQGSGRQRDRDDKSTGDNAGQDLSTPAGVPGQHDPTDLPRLRPETMERLLKAFALKEKQVQSKLVRRALGNPRKNEKDW